MYHEFDVFLSHASEDKDKIRRLATRLKELDVSVFFDEEVIGWGDSITDAINNGLLRSTFFVPFLTSTFARKGWTNKELNSSIQQNISRKGRILVIKDASFQIEDRYPVLNDVLYKTWPDDNDQVFIEEVASELLAKVKQERLKKHALK